MVDIEMKRGYGERGGRDGGMKGWIEGVQEGGLVVCNIKDVCFV